MEATPEQTAEGVAIVRVLAAVLDRLVTANAPVARADPGQVTKFHAMKAPGIGIYQYLERIHKYASCSNECFILALIYIDRLIQRSNFLLIELNVHRVVITSVLLAAKFFDDAYYNNAYYAKVGGVLVSEMNGLEVDFLFRINFSLHVTPEIFEKYRAELVLHSQTASLGSQQAMAQSPIYGAVRHHSPVHVSQQNYSQPMSHTPPQRPPLYTAQTRQPSVCPRPPVYNTISNQTACPAPACITTQHATQLSHDFSAQSHISPSPPAEPEDLFTYDVPDHIQQQGLVAIQSLSGFDSFIPITNANSLPAITHAIAAATTTSTPPFYVSNQNKTTCRSQDTFTTTYEEQPHHYVFVDNQVFPMHSHSQTHGGYAPLDAMASVALLNRNGLHFHQQQLHHHHQMYSQHLLVNPLVGARMLTGVSGAGS